MKEKSTPDYVDLVLLGDLHFEGEDGVRTDDSNSTIAKEMHLIRVGTIGETELYL